MSKRFVTLGDGARVSLGNYVRAWKIAAYHTLPTTRLSGCPQGANMTVSRDECLRQFRAGMHDRINRHLPGYGRSRKWDSDWQRAALQCAIAVNTPRLIVRWAPMEFRSRLAHRIETGDND